MCCDIIYISKCDVSTIYWKELLTVSDIMFPGMNKSQDVPQNIPTTPQTADNEMECLPNLYANIVSEDAEDETGM